MAITLPDFTALPSATPRPVIGPLQYPANDAGAIGLAELGKGVGEIGKAVTDTAAYQDIAQSKMDRAMADADFANRTIPLTEQLKVETDPEKISNLRAQFATAAETASNAIAHPGARQHWLLSHARTIATGEAEADLRNASVYRDKYKAGGIDQVQELTRNGVGGPDAFNVAQAGIDRVVDGFVANGMPATEAQALRAKYKADLVAGRIDNLINSNQFDAARGLLQEHRTALGGVAGEVLDAKLERKAATAGAAADVNAMFGSRGTGFAPRGGGATGLIPYTPSGDILSGTGLTPEQYQTYRSHLGSREGSYGIMGGSSGKYAGRYQMGPDEIKETATRLGVPAPSQQEFLNNPKLQEQFLENYTLDHHNSLMQQSEKYRNASPTEKAAILAGAHLTGVGSVQTYLTGKGDPADAFGTPASSYVGSMRRAMTGAPAAGPATQVAADVAVGGTAAPAATAPPPAAAPSPGMLGQGNLDPTTVPGGRVGLQSASPVQINDGPLKGKYLLLPGVTADGTALTPDQQTDQYEKDGKHLGVFDSAQAATAHGQRLGTGQPAGTTALGVAVGPTGPTGPRPSGPRKFTAAGGDSIGLSAIKNADLPGTYADDKTKLVYTGADRKNPVAGRIAGQAMTVGGRDAAGNFTYLDAHPEEFRNKDVFWSSGLMNAGKSAEEARKQLPEVAKALDRLKELGANVVVVGVDKGKFAPLNRELEALASEKRLPFGGALPTTNVHPSAEAMRGYVNKAAQLLPSSGGGGPTPAPTTAGGSEDDQGGDYGGGGDTAAPAGQLEPGNIDLNARPIVRNAPGKPSSKSTVRSISISEGDGKQVLIPTVAADGSRVLSDDEAVQQYRDTGQHLGKFDTIENANAAAEALHQEQAAQYSPGSGASTVRSPDLIPPSATPAPPGAGTSAPTFEPHKDAEVAAKIAEWRAQVAAGTMSLEAADRRIALLEQRYGQYNAELAPAREALAAKLRDGAAALKDGHPFDYNNDEIRHYYPKAKADQIIQELGDARDVGQLKVKVAGTTSAEELQTMKSQLEARLARADTTGYAKAETELKEFKQAADKRGIEIEKAAVEADVNQMFGGGRAAAVEPGARLQPAHDLDAMITATLQRVKDGEITPARGDATITLARQRFNQEQALEHNDRTALDRELTGGAAALENGNNVEWSPEQIRHYWSGEEADRRIQMMQDATTVGGFKSEIDNSARADITKRVGELSAWVNDPAAAAEYPRRAKLAANYAKALAAHDKAMTDDSAAYTVATSPLVNQKYQTYLDERDKRPSAQAVNMDTAEVMHARAFADYAQTTLAEQERRGVPKNLQRVLSNNQVAGIAQSIAGIDPTVTPAAAAMRSMARGYGNYWQQVYGELVQHGKLPGDYQVLAVMDRPNQLVAADDLSRAIRFAAKKGGAAAAKSEAGAEVTTKLDAAIDDAMEEFKASTRLGDRGQDLYDTVRNAAKKLTEYYGYMGEGQNAAIEHAVDGIINNKYDFGAIDNAGQTKVRVPKGTLLSVESAAQRVKASLDPDELGPVPGNPRLTPVERKAIWMGGIKNGTWANNEDDSGIVLMARLRNGAPVPVMRADGTRVELKFDNVPAIVGVGAPVVPPQLQPDEPMYPAGLYPNPGQRPAQTVVGGPGAF